MITNPSLTYPFAIVYIACAASLGAAPRVSASIAGKTQALSYRQVVRINQRSAEEIRREMDERDAADRKINYPPLQEGVWLLRIDAEGKQRAEEQAHCFSGDLPFMFRPFVTVRSPMLPGGGLLFSSKSIGVDNYLLRSEVQTSKLGPTVAEHKVKMHGVRSFSDEILLRARGSEVHQSMVGLWLRGCQP